MALPRIYKETLPTLLMAGLGLVTAGLLLEGMRGVLENTPGLLIIVPALIAIRGGISGAMGARLGSAFHMGLIGEGNLWNEESRQNVLAAFALNLIFSLAVGGLAHLSAVLLGIPSAGLVRLVVIATLAGVGAGTVQVGITFGVILIAFRRGLDPDNVTAPALATLGDIITMLLLLLVAVGAEVVL